MKKPVKAALVLALIALGFVWRPAWGLLIVFVLVEWAEDRWKELLGAIRGRRRSSSESKQEPDELQEEFEQQQEYERQIETAHQKNQFKHVHGLRWAIRLPMSKLRLLMIWNGRGSTESSKLKLLPVLRESCELLSHRHRYRLFYFRQNAGGPSVTSFARRDSDPHRFR